jgi:hypothetical protein
MSCKVVNGNIVELSNLTGVSPTEGGETKELGTNDTADTSTLLGARSMVSVNIIIYITMYNDVIISYEVSVL